MCRLVIIVWNGTAKGGEWICKEKSVTECLSLSSIVLVVTPFLVYVIIFFYLGYFVVILINYSVFWWGEGGRDSSVGIATRYGLGGPGFESRWGRDFPHPSRAALGPTQPHIHWVGGNFRG